MLALTEMMYAMAKKVARPALISVQKYVFFRSLGWRKQSDDVRKGLIFRNRRRSKTHMSTALKAEVAPYK